MADPDSTDHNYKGRVDFSQADYPMACVYWYPRGQPAATTLYSEGTYTISLSGAGALRITDQEIINCLSGSGALSPRDALDCNILHPENSFTRLLWIKKGYNNSSPNLDGHNAITQAANGAMGNRMVELNVSNSNSPTTLLTLDWVPTTVPQEDIKEIATSFCEVKRITRDRKQPMRYYINTTTPEDNIPHWVHVDGMIGTDDNIRTFKIGLRGRFETCHFCGDENHRHFRCPYKADTSKARREQYRDRTAEYYHALREKEKEEKEQEMALLKKVFNEWRNERRSQQEPENTVQEDKQDKTEDKDPNSLGKNTDNDQKECLQREEELRRSKNKALQRANTGDNLSGENKTINKKADNDTQLGLGERPDDLANHQREQADKIRKKSKDATKKRADSEKAKEIAEQEDRKIKDRQRNLKEQARIQTKAKEKREQRIREYQEKKERLKKEKPEKQERRKSKRLSGCQGPTYSWNLYEEPPPSQSPPISPTPPAQNNKPPLTDNKPSEDKQSPQAILDSQTNIQPPEDNHPPQSTSDPQPDKQAMQTVPDSQPDENSDNNSERTISLPQSQMPDYTQVPPPKSLLDDDPGSQKRRASPPDEPPHKTPRRNLFPHEGESGSDLTAGGSSEKRGLTYTVHENTVFESSSAEEAFTTPAHSATSRAYDLYGKPDNNGLRVVSNALFNRLESPHIFLSTTADPNNDNSSSTIATQLT